MRHGHRMVTFSLFNSTINRAIYTDSFSKDTLRYVRKSRTRQRESLQILKAGKDQHHPRQAFTHLYGLYNNSMFLHLLVPNAAACKPVYDGCTAILSSSWESAEAPTERDAAMASPFTFLYRCLIPAWSCRLIINRPIICPSGTIVDQIRMLSPF